MRASALPLSLLLILTACTASTVKGMPLPAGTFTTDSSEGGGAGTVYARGYAIVSRVQEPFCSRDPEETEDCQAFDYVFFRIINAGSAGIDRFIAQNQDNAYVGRKSIGLGCLGGDGTIAYVNDSDAYGRKTFTLPKDLTEKILRSSVRDPVTLALTKEKLTGGSEAPPCYAHFTGVQAMATAQ